MGVSSKQSAQNQVEIAKAQVEYCKEYLAKARERLAYERKGRNWNNFQRFPVNGKPGLYRQPEVEVFRWQRELAKAKEQLERAKKNLAHAKKK